MIKKKKLNNLNIIRGFLTLYVVLVHIRINIGCSFGQLNEVFDLRNPIMTGFFVLSGFVIYYNYSKTEFSTYKDIAEFLKRRILNFYPIYALIWIFYFYYQMGDTTIQEDIITFPMQFFALFGINYYNYLINIGTWFFSCIFICYLIFPYICRIVNSMNYRQLVSFMIIIYAINSSIPFKIQGSYYSAFCRVLEFSAGIITARAYLEKQIAVSKEILLMFSLAVLMINFGLIKINLFSIAWNQERINFFSLPAACGLTYCFACCEENIIDDIARLKTVKFFSDYSLECYAGALPTMIVFCEFISKYNLNNILVFIIAFLLNLVFAILLKKYAEKAKIIIKNLGFHRSAIIFAGIIFASIGMKFITKMLEV